MTPSTMTTTTRMCRNQPGVSRATDSRRGRRIGFHLRNAALLLFSTGSLHGALVLDQIGDPLAYDLELPAAPAISQIFTDFPDFSSMVIEDFNVASGGYEITRVSALFQAQAGFTAFQGVSGYALSIFSDPSLAASGLAGDVASLVVSAGSGASVTQIIDPDNTGEYGLVSLDVSVLLPVAGTYWVGVAPVSAVGVTGQFSVVHDGAAGSTLPGPAGSRWANPQDAFDLGTITTLTREFAYSVTAVPEPSTTMLPLVSPALLLLRRRKP